MKKTILSLTIRLVGEQKAAAFDKGRQKDYYVLQGVSSIGNLEKLYFDVKPACWNALRSSVS